MITATVSDMRENLSDLLGNVQHSGERVTILKHGKPVAVVVSAGEHAFLEECESLYWAQEVARIEAEPGYDPNDTVPHEEFWASLHAEDQAQSAAE